MYVLNSGHVSYKLYAAYMCCMSFLEYASTMIRVSRICHARPSYLTTVLRRVERASLWKVMMTEVAGRRCVLS
jgi:hypothetical protein